MCVERAPLAHVICHRSPAGADAAKDRRLGMVCVEDTVVGPLVGCGGSRWLFWLSLSALSASLWPLGIYS